MFSLKIEFPEINPIVIGIWSGRGKPPINEYLTPLIDELKEVLENGMNINGHSIKIKFGWCICDSPARAHIKGLDF